MVQLDRDDLSQIVRDAFYATVGVGVLTAQHLDQVRRQIGERLSAQYGSGRQQVDQLRALVEAQLSALDDRMKALEGQLDGLLDAVQDRLPEQAGDAFARARRVSAEARKVATEAGGRLTALVRDSAA
jgi:hypothetical protein